MVYLNKQGLSEVLSEGNICANILFNYKQCVGKQVNKDDAELMNQHQVLFDAALRKFEKNLQ